MTAMVQAVGPLPTHAPDGRLRRTLRAVDQIDTARSARNQVILSGPAAHDVFVDEAGRALHLADLVRSYCAARGLGLVSYRLETGPVSLPTLVGGGSVEVSARPRDDEPPAVSVRRVFDDLRAAAVPSVVLVDYADLVLPAGPGHDLGTAVLVETVQALAADVAGWQDAGVQLILCDRGGGLMGRLTGQAGFVVVPLDPPDVTETEMYLSRKTSPGTKRRLHLAPDLPVDRASRLSGGLLLRSLADAASASSPEQPLTARGLSERKGIEIRQQSQNTLELVDQTVSFANDVAGLASIRLTVQDHLLAPSSNLQLTLAGPPGTGKTYAASAVAELLGVPMVTFGQILGELLGQAENNMRLAISMVRSMSPVMLFVDEADQGPLGSAAGRGSTGNEAHLALRAMLFELFGDPGDGNGVHTLLTTNVPDRLDARTRSRFSVVPVFHATGPELGRVLEIQARKAHIPLHDDLTALTTRLVEAGSVFSGRSAKELLDKSWTLARRGRDESVGEWHVEEALRGWTGNDWDVESEYSTLATLAAVRHADHFPWVAARILGEHQDVPVKLRPYVKDDGTPRMQPLHDRLNHLRTVGAW